MQLKSISISHMHQITGTATYDLNNATYFVGPNGAGKSTILQAIQLALLGYIPGYDKTNAGIFKHSSDGKELEVTLVLTEDDVLYSITRRWYKSGNTVKGELRCVPADFNPASILGNIELPVFDFNKFKSMTANELKAWFIGFLPKDEFEIDWKEYLVSELGSRAALLPDELLEDALSYIQENSATLAGVDLVKSLNEWLKSQQTFQKSQVGRLQDTLNSMIYYNDIEDANADDIHAKLSEKRKLKDELIRYEATEQSYQRMKAEYDAGNIDAIKKEIDDLCSQMDQILQQQSEIVAAYDPANTEYTKLAMELCKYNTPSGDICPYTNTRCAEIASKVQAASETKSRISAEMNKLQETIKPLSEKLRQLNINKDLISSRLTSADSKHHRLCVLQEQLTNFAIVERPTTDSLDMIECDLKALEQDLIKIRANEQFKELNDKITKEKYKAENAVEVLKIWVNSTGPNGLQTYMMEKPFTALADDMSKYLSNMFGTDSIASFHLEEKANSFSFGMIKEEGYIEFDLLSSGEKCLFTIALILCLLNRSDAELKLLLADDILDHLDDQNADRFFTGLATSDIQCVLAGVKNCSNKDICIEIGG